MMTIEELRTALIDRGEFLEFDRVANKLSQRPDLHAFLLLDRLLPSARDMVQAADHDIIYLDVDLDELCRVITPADVVDLRRCGVILDEEYDILAMFA